jgi:hypothetical protein
MPASPLLASTGLLAVALSLALGWGIRGNYGHETGAMLPGALAAIAACLASGRADWRARVPFFALFGALGWAFGGSISYMQVIGYTHSGHLPSQLYGFAALFLIGFLWGALGGGGTALPAVLDRQRLEGLFPPLLVACAAMSVPELVTSVIDDAAAVGGAMRRQDSPLYWLDSDWLQAVAAIFAMLAYDVVERRFAHSGELLVRGAAGAVAGATIQLVLHAAGLDAHLWRLLVRTQGDPSLFPVEQFVTNWPNALPAAIPHLGSITGLLLGIGSFFARHGRFSGGARLVVMLALGWLAGFLILPVVLGLRLTPPRGDDWAGILGVVVAAILWCRRERLPEVTIAMIVAGTIGGLGFSGAALLKLLMVAPGNPGIVSDPVVVAAWRHWQGANWHSFLEQTYGFVNGLGIAVALGLLATRLAPLDDAGPRRRWTEIVAVLGVVPWLLHANLVKNVADWTALHGDHRALPLAMKAPLLAGNELTATGWFDLFFAVAAAAFTFLCVVQRRRPLAIVPPSWLGRGQLLAMLVLWPMVLGNFAKALPGFTEQRLLTEGSVLVCAVIVTLLLLLLPDGETRICAGSHDALRPLGFRAPASGTLAALVLAATLAPLVETAITRAVYGNTAAGHAGPNLRFGPEANWRTKPILKGSPHR